MTNRERAETIDKAMREGRCRTHGGPDVHLGTGCLDCGACRVHIIEAGLDAGDKAIEPDPLGWDDDPEEGPLLSDELAAMRRAIEAARTVVQLMTWPINEHIKVTELRDAIADFDRLETK